MAHSSYHCDLNREDFFSDQDYLLERVKGGMAAGYTFQQCYEHWLTDFAMGLRLSKEEIDSMLHPTKLPPPKIKTHRG